MIYTIELNGESYTLDLRGNLADGTWQYTLTGATTLSGPVSIAEIAVGTFSLLLNNKSFTVRVNRAVEGLEVWSGSQRYLLSIADPRDRSRRSRKPEAKGMVEVSTQMPGKVVKLLVGTGERVEIGQGLVVVEAMKMQNELKAPKDGSVKAINVGEGATVAAGESLVVIE